MTDLPPELEADPSDPAKEARRDPTMAYKAVIVVLATAVVVLGGLLLTRPSTPSAAVPAATVTATVTVEAGAPAEQPQPTLNADEQAQLDQFLLTELPRRAEGDPLAWGSVDAPVVLTEWADYRCPFCSVWAEQVLPGLLPYIEEGKLRIEFRDLALFGDESIKAATAARAAGEQGMFFEFSHSLFSALPNEGHPDIPDELVYQIVAELGLDAEQFKTDWANPAHQEAVLADTAEAQGLGVGSTPSFVIGNQFVSGAQPLEAFEAIIDEQLALHG